MVSEPTPSSRFWRFFLPTQSFSIPATSLPRTIYHHQKSFSKVVWYTPVLLELHSSFEQLLPMQAPVKWEIQAWWVAEFTTTRKMHLNKFHHTSGTMRENPNFMNRSTCSIIRIAASPGDKFQLPSRSYMHTRSALLVQIDITIRNWKGNTASVQNITMLKWC